MRPWTSYFKDSLTAADIVMSVDKLTAIREYTNLGTFVMAQSTISGLRNSYVEVKITFTQPGSLIGITNGRAPTGDPSSEPGYLGATNDSIGLSSDGTVALNNKQIGTGPAYANGDVVAIAINGGAQTVSFRNVTQNTGWFGLFPIFPLGLPPYHLGVSMRNVGDNGVANFYGPFTGTPPTGYLNWNPEALFSEQPVKVLDFDAVIADGNYSSTDVNDLEPMPFSYIRWGDANLDAQNNLRFTDWVLQDDDDADWPLLSLTEQATAAPANNYIWGQWDGGPIFLIIRFHFFDTNPVNISNIPIPPPTATAPNLGEGHVLALFVSCDTTANFTFTNGRVFGTENVLVWEPIEYATFPPSAPGIVQPVIPSNIIQGGSWGPPIGPPL